MGVTIINDSACSAVHFSHQIPNHVGCATRAFQYPYGLMFLKCDRKLIERSHATAYHHNRIRRTGKQQIEPGVFKARIHNYIKVIGREAIGLGMCCKRGGWRKANRKTALLFSANSCPVRSAVGRARYQNAVVAYNFSPDFLCLFQCIFGAVSGVGSTRYANLEFRFPYRNRFFWCLRHAFILTRPYLPYKAPSHQIPSRLVYVGAMPMRRLPRPEPQTLSWVFRMRAPIA